MKKLCKIMKYKEGNNKNMKEMQINRFIEDEIHELLNFGSVTGRNRNYYCTSQGMKFVCYITYYCLSKNG